MPLPVSPVIYSFDVIESGLGHEYGLQHVNMYLLDRSCTIKARLHIKHSASIRQDLDVLNPRP